MAGFWVGGCGAGRVGGRELLEVRRDGVEDSTERCERSTRSFIRRVFKSCSNCVVSAFASIFSLGGTGGAW